MHSLIQDRNVCILLISLVYVADVSKLIFINETKRKIFINMLNQIIRKILVTI